MFDRRNFLKLAALLGGTTAFSGCGSLNNPLNANVWKPLDENDLPFAGLATTLSKEYDYETVVKGRIPSEIKGILYRNGPGRFDRGRFRKRMLLDGDGMIQAFRFRDGAVHYQNRFVRTKKYVEEEAAGEFLYATWSTPAPGGPLSNLGAYKEIQANVTVIYKDDALYAFDEGAFPYRLDPWTLETIGMSRFGFPETDKGFWAHWKVDGTTGDWFLFNLSYGLQNAIEVTIIGRNEANRRRWRIEIPRRVYIHDWLVSDHHVIFILHPAVISTSGIIQLYLGLNTFAGVIGWKPERGNLILVMDREGKERPLFLETDARWSWHSLNAYERGNEIIADFVGAEDAVGIGSNNAPLFVLMEGRYPEDPSLGKVPAIRRYVINLSSKSIREEIIAEENHYEMPYLNPRFSCHRHRYGYFARGGPSKGFWSSIARIDTEEGRVESYDFPKDHYCSEPVFVPRPGFVYQNGSKEEPGWLLTLVLNGSTKTSYLAVFLSDRVTEGPIALAHLTHHVPISFHGVWQPGAHLF